MYTENSSINAEGSKQSKLLPLTSYNCYILTLKTNQLELSVSLRPKSEVSVVLALNVYNMEPLILVAPKIELMAYPAANVLATFEISQFPPGEVEDEPIRSVCFLLSEVTEIEPSKEFSFQPKSLCSKNEEILSRFQSLRLVYIWNYLVTSYLHSKFNAVFNCMLFVYVFRSLVVSLRKVSCFVPVLFHVTKG